MTVNATVHDPLLLAPPLQRFLIRRLPTGRFGAPRTDGSRTGTVAGISTTYSPRRAHEGVDLNASQGDPVFAVTDGTIVVSGSSPTDSRGPAWVILDHHPSVTPPPTAPPPATALGHLSVYYHLSVGLPVGTTVREGQLIGFVGSHPSGPHLHFELRHVTNPAGNPAADTTSVPLNPGPSLEPWAFTDTGAVETDEVHIRELRLLQHKNLSVPYLRVRLDHDDNNYFLPMEHPTPDQLQAAELLRASGSHGVRLRYAVSSWHAGRKIIRGVQSAF
ncbi:M23 family metallopeptidase [Streptomyces sp. MUM 178J]|uniref:M23 family metallopeptidase n=1 Tax=Streptomyces sp. MUM 178J TaxID=2791991 RepID=UPI001F03A628|nr:M23 family metallopeptidase [Streptomyces sp. MUM 178J]WRQ82683.1 M23 family metallopeptidase [Streptomyces sp. MUM 178J]